MRPTGIWMLAAGAGLALATTHALAMQTAPAPPAAASPSGAAAAPPAGPGLDLINERCGFCHSTAQVFAQRRTAASWSATVQSMADRGAEVSPDEQKVIVDYLVKNYGAPAGAPAAGAAPPAGAR